MHQVEQRGAQMADAFQRGDPVRRVWRGENERVQWTGEPLPLISLQPHQHHGDHGGDGVRQVQHQIDLTRLPVAVDPLLGEVRMTGSQRVVAVGVNHGKRRRLYAWNAGPSISEGMPR